MDKINEDKADTKDATNTAGSILTTAGIGTTVGGAVAGNEDAVIAGLGAATAGMITQGVASSMNPKSDIRTWDLLPATIHLFSFQLSSAHNIEIDLSDPSKKVIQQHKISPTNIPKSRILFMTER